MLSDKVLRNALIILAVLLFLVYVWKPLRQLNNPLTVTNDFVVETVDGVLDSKQLRGKVLAVTLAYGNCTEECAGRLGRLAKGYQMLPPQDRGLVRVILVSVDPDRDTPQSMAAYAKRFDADMIGATAKPENLKALADGFGATYEKMQATPDGAYRVEHHPAFFLVDAEGHFASVINANVTPEAVAQALRSKLPAVLPPS